MEPASACVAFGLSAPGVTIIPLDTTNPKRVAGNMGRADISIPIEFWEAAADGGLIDWNYADQYLLNT